MNREITLVVEDSRILSDICGINDHNLKVLEELLDIKIATRGNELFLQTEDKEKRELFLTLVKKIQEQLQKGRPAEPELIKTLYQNLLNEEKDNSDLFSETFLKIPGTVTKVYPRSLKQAQYLQAMHKYDLVFGIGPAGTGKTYLAVAYALQEILSKKKKKLILTRPVVEAGESLGFLPGDFAQKIAPYLRPLYDAMDSLISVDTISRLEENRIIEIVPLAYMRGRSLNNSYIILDEAQNTTKEQMKMFLTRLGEGSRAIITGDITQIDLPSRTVSGLIHASRILKPLQEISFVYFSAQDVIRNPLVKKIVQAYETENPNQ